MSSLSQQWNDQQVLSLPASAYLPVRPSIQIHVCLLWSPDLNQRCKRTWLRTKSFWGWLTLTKFNFKVIQYLIWAFPNPISSPIQARITIFYQSYIISWLRAILLRMLIDLDTSDLTSFKNHVTLHHFLVFQIFVRRAKQGLVNCSTPNMARAYADSLIHADRVAPWTVLV